MPPEQPTEPLTEYPSVMPQPKETHASDPQAHGHAAVYWKLEEVKREEGVQGVH